MNSTYWWCLEHKCVEENGGCGSTSRVGPYDTRQEAEAAPERMRSRAAQQDAKDKAQGKD